LGPTLSPGSGQREAQAAVLGRDGEAVQPHRRGRGLDGGGYLVGGLDGLLRGHDPGPDEVAHGGEDLA
jgi:hypothetical protein